VRKIILKMVTLPDLRSTWETAGNHGDLNHRQDWPRNRHSTGQNYRFAVHFTSQTVHGTQGCEFPVASFQTDESDPNNLEKLRPELKCKEAAWYFPKFPARKRKSNNDDARQLDLSRTHGRQAQGGYRQSIPQRAEARGSWGCELPGQRSNAVLL
jgi:hypothetical protein